LTLAEPDTTSHQEEQPRDVLTVRRVSTRALAAVTRQLATLLRGGMAIVPALGALVEQREGEPLAAVLARVRDRVKGGASLADALADYPRVFPEIYANMVRAGEAAGALETVLFRLAEMYEKRANLANRVRAAMAYPALMAVIGSGVVLFLLYYVIPSIAKLFTDMGQALPWPTVALILIAGFVETWLWALLAAATGLYVAWRLWSRTPSGRLKWDTLTLRLPLVGGLQRKLAVARFARTLGVLLGSGVTILDALDIAGRTVGNAIVEKAILAARDSVGRGDSLANSLRRGGVFPPLVHHMIATGEASGGLEEGLLNVAQTYDNEVETAVEALTSLLEPLMILVMGAVVGFIVVAILLPIFDINQAVR